MWFCVALGSDHLSYLRIRELGQLEFDNDDKAAKEFSKFLVRLAHAAPRLLNKNLSLLMGQFDSEVGAKIDMWRVP